MTTSKSRRRGRRLVIFAIILALVGVGAWRLFRKKEELIAVQVGAVVRRDITETVVSNGRLLPVTQVMISPEVAGEIIELPVKDGQQVKKGDLLVQIKPDNYRASANSAQASLQVAQAMVKQAQAQLEKAAADFKRNADLLKSKLIAEDKYAEFQTTYAVAQVQLESAQQQVEQARFALDKANDDLSKTTITSPLDGTVTNLKSQLGERVLGTSFNMGTEMMTVAKLDQMEARVDIGEIDIVLIKEGQKAHIEVDAFKNRKFNGVVSAIANATRSASMTSTAGNSTQNQEAPKFEVKIRLSEQEAFRPGMSVTAEVETRAKQGVLAVPIQSVTTRLGAASLATPKPGSAPVKAQEVVFAVEGDHAKMLPVKTGISDSDFFEITEGLTEGQKIITGGYKAVGKDLEDGKKVTTGAAAEEKKP